ncbi:Hsp70 family protein [Ruminococcus sp. NK3A76]|uniref:Hsp70 family protein n=1 Tax=Ruminococcus sp. NK3A76 TaxID=877411 RepID=UPI00068E0634|nr:Hsp70 family protein [Ruminococcus sp. NK3A76]
MFTDGLTVGIDLGTTYSVVAYIDPATKTPVVIPNKLGQRTTPSVVAFSPDGSVIIGSDAKTRSEMSDPNTASFYKLEMGSRSYKVSFFGEDMDASCISGKFLRELISQCEKSVGRNIKRAVITVPAYFEDPERNATIRAGKQAGLEVIGVINEPTAAAIAYGLKDTPQARKILIYDLGGGTFDVTVADVSHDSIKVIASAGNHYLGGKNWDEVICTWLCEQFEEEFGADPSEDKETYNSLMVKAEKAKKLLSSSEYADVTVSYEGGSGKYRLTESIFRELSADLLDITHKTISRMFDDTGLRWTDIGGVILVGGSTKMKMVPDYIRRMTGREPQKGVDADEAVAIGAAIQAQTEEYCAVKTLGSLSVQPRGFLTGQDRSAYDMSLLRGAKFISDVTAHSLGMISVSEDGRRFVNDIMIKKNTPLSKAKVVKRRELPVSMSGNELEIYLLQGDSQRPSDCTAAKKYVFSGVGYVPGGKTLLDITYRYTVDGTIDITAVQTETGRQLLRREEPVPDDMSWTDGVPESSMLTPIAKNDGVLYLALDLSGSMEGGPLQMAKDAMKDFVEQFDTDRINIGIACFAEKAKIRLDATWDKKAIRKAIDSIDKKTDLGRGTNAEPLTVMLPRIRKYSYSGFKYAVILTDGSWYDGADLKALRLKEEYVRNGIEIVALGFGKAKYGFLRELSTREDLAEVEDIAGLDRMMLRIAKIIQQ